MKKIALAVISLLPMTAACSSTPSKTYHKAWGRADFEQAETLIDAAILEDNPNCPKPVRPRTTNLESGNTCLYALDKGMARLAQRDARGATSWLEAARHQLDVEFGHDLDEFVASILTDDTALGYAGADYEQILVRAILALSELAGGGVDAYAYALQVGQRQSEILGSSLGVEYGYEPRKAYERIPLGLYIEGIILESERSADTGLIFRKVDEWTGGSSATIRAAVERADSGKFCDLGNGVLHLIYLAGSGPELVEGEQEATELATQIASLLLAHINKSNIPLVQDRVPVPVVHHQGRPHDLEVAVPAFGIAGRTEVLLDINQIAEQQVEANRPFEVARALIRRSVKAHLITQYAQEHGIPEFAAAMIMPTLTFTEKADTRRWASLPASIHVARLELPAGSHEMHFSDGNIQTVEVLEGEARYILVIRPDLSKAGVLLQSKNASPLERSNRS